MPEHDFALGRVLLAIARSAIAAELRLPPAHDDDPGHEALARPAATFVTLKQADELRGCIGSLEAIRPLGVDVRENAIAAAFRDPRFPPLRAREYAATTVEISLLSTGERIDVASEEELLARLRPGVDGLILRHGRQRATFLPQVWETLPEPREFVAALKRKAGLPAGFWSAQMSVARYAVTKWSEGDVAGGAKARWTEAHS